MIRSLFRYRAGELVANPAEVEQALRGPLPADAVEQLFQEIAAESADPASFIWVKMQDPTDTEIADLQRIFGLSAVQIDEIKDPRQRPALESDPPKVFVILKELRYVEETSDVETGQVSVFLGPGFALSIRYGDAAPGSSRDRLAQEPELLTYGPAGVLYAICDVIVDGYLNVSRELDLDVSEIEERIFADDLDDLPPEGKRRGPNRYFAHIRKHEQWKPAVQGYLASIYFADTMLGHQGNAHHGQSAGSA